MPIITIINGSTFVHKIGRLYETYTLTLLVTAISGRFIFTIDK